MSKPTSARRIQHRDRLPPGRHGLSSAAVHENQRQRLIAAMAAVCVSPGYAAASIADIVKAAGVSRNTFYDFFESKEQCLLAAHEDYERRVCAAIDDAACGGGEGRAGRLRLAVRAALAFLAADPAVGHLLTAAILSVGRGGAERYQAMIDALAARLRCGAASPPETCGPEWGAIVLATSLIAKTATRGDPAAILAFEDYFTALFLDPPTLAITARPSRSERAVS